MMEKSKQTMPLPGDEEKRRAQLLPVRVRSNPCRRERRFSVAYAGLMCQWSHPWCGGLLFHPN